MKRSWPLIGVSVFLFLSIFTLGCGKSTTVDPAPQAALETVVYGVTDATVVLSDSQGKEVSRKTSDSNGKVLFEGLTPGSYVCKVLKDGYVISPDAGRLVSVSASINKVSLDPFYATPKNSFYIAFTAKDSQGTPIQGVQVTGSKDNKQVIQGTTDAQGNFLTTNLSPGTYSVTAAKSGYTLTVPRGTSSFSVSITNANATILITGTTESSPSPTASPTPTPVPTPTPTPHPWTTTTVDSNGETGRYTSIALDRNNKVHIGYKLDEPSYDLKYATNASGSWESVIADPGEGSEGQDVGNYPSIALDSNGKAHISHYDFSNQVLKYATNASGSWKAETVDSDRNVGFNTSIALDSKDKVHITYYRLTDNALRYATNKSGSWKTEVVEIVLVDVDLKSSIAIDKNDGVHIGYADFTTGGTLKYAYRAAGQASWSKTSIDSVSNTNGLHLSLALDSSGNPHIAYYVNFLKLITYAKKSGGTWTYDTVDTGIEHLSDSDISLAIDSKGTPHVSYYDNKNKRLKYSYKTSGGWVNEVVDSTGDVGTRCSLAVDGSDKAHIAYRDKTNKALKYATWN